MEMIIASSESTSGDMTKLLSMFRSIAKPITNEEQKKAIREYVKSKKLKDKINP
jgi:hypothetical protein